LSLQVDASTMAPIKDLAVGQATKISAVAIGFLHSESIRQMPDFLHVAIGQEDFDDVEADFHRRVSEQAQVIESGAGKALSPLAVHCGSRPGPFFGGAGFDLDEDQAILFAKDEIDLTSR